MVTMTKGDPVVQKIGLGACIVAVLVAVFVHIGFAATLMSLYALGWFMAGCFIWSWVPLAFRARALGRRGVSLVRILDYAGVNVAVFVIFALLLYNFHRFGVPPSPKDHLYAGARIAIPVVFDVLVLIRLTSWVRALRQARQGRGTPDPLRSMADRDEFPDEYPS